LADFTVYLEVTLGKQTDRLLMAEGLGDEYFIRRQGEAAQGPACLFCCVESEASVAVLILGIDKISENKAVVEDVIDCCAGQGAARHTVDGIS
jgi:hypothetical protein